MPATCSDHRQIKRHFVGADQFAGAAAPIEPAIAGPIHQWISRRASRRRRVFTLAALVTLGFVNGPSAQPWDLETLLLTQVAAVSAGPTVSPDRSGPRSAETSGSKRLLAESPLPVSVEAGSSEETILAAFALSAPHSLEEEVASEHKLQLLDRMEVPLVGLRIVRYRVPDSRPITMVITSLRRDQRVSKAQASVQYRRPSQGPPAAEVSSLAERPAPVANGAPDARTRESARRHPDRKTALLQEAQKTRGEQLRMTEAEGTVRVVKLRRVKEERPVASATALRWPSADEPFVNVGGANR